MQIYAWTAGLLLIASLPGCGGSASGEREASSPYAPGWSAVHADGGNTDYSPVEGAADVALAWERHFEGSVRIGPLPWTINLSVSEQWWTYDQPDVVVDPTTTRYQNDTILNLVLTVPFDERTTFSLSGGRFVRAATVPNYAFDNNSFMFGVSWRF